MSSLKQSTCIYCGQRRPFTDEHVFPAGLGGDDRRYLLKGLVCGHCNTDIFSKLESRFMRSSPVAIARIFLQHRGRGKGKRASVPTIDSRTTTVFFEQYGAVEAELAARGKPNPLMQFLFLDEGKVGFTGGEHGTADEFMRAVAEVLGDSVRLVEKRSISGYVDYLVETFNWMDDGGFTSVAKVTATMPPSCCIWREPLAPVNDNTRPARAPTLYQRTAGQIVLRTKVDEDAALLLTQARRAVEGFKPEDIGPYASLESPLVHVSMSMNLSDYTRILAKIGVNVVAHVFGEEYVRHYAFNKIKECILTNNANIRVGSPSAAGNIFSGVPDDRHVLMVGFLKSRAGRFHVVLFIRLYGTTSLVHLSANGIRPPNADLIFLVVDYNKHRIEQHNTSRAFVMAYPPVIPDDDLPWQASVDMLLH